MPRLFASDREAFLAEAVVEPLDMLGTRGLEDKFDFGFTDRHLTEASALADLQNIRAQGGDALCDAREVSRTVLDDHREPAQAAVLNQTFFDDARNQIHVDVATGNDQTYALAAERNLFVHQRREGYGRSAFRNRFLDFQQ